MMAVTPQQTQKMSITKHCLVQAAILVIIFSFSITAANITVSQAFTDAIDAATADYIVSTEWSTTLNTLGLVYFAAPTCSPKPTYPAKFDFTKTTMTMCYELNPGYPWDALHEKAGNMLLATLNKKYATNIQPKFIQVDTAALGYFNTLKTMTNNGSCDVAIASTNYDSVRASQVHFQCKYGASSQGWLRSALNASSIVINQASDLNRTDVTIVLFKGSVHDDYAKANFPAAKIIRTAGNYESYPYILNNMAHVMIADAVDLYNWLKNHTNDCASCSTKAFGDPSAFGSFTTNNIYSGAWSVSSSMNSMVLLLVLLVGFLLQ